MPQQYSAGILVFRRTNGPLEVLLGRLEAALGG
jgi:predicted NUDIX family NTP pyrophosphohydrolase